MVRVGVRRLAAVLLLLLGGSLFATALLLAPLAAVLAIGGSAVLAGVALVDVDKLTGRG